MILKKPLLPKGFLKSISFGTFLVRDKKSTPKNNQFHQNNTPVLHPQLIFIPKTPRAPFFGARGVFYSGRVDIWGLYAGEVMVTSGA